MNVHKKLFKLIVFSKFIYNSLHPFIVTQVKNTVFKHFNHITFHDACFRFTWTQIWYDSKQK